MRLFVYEHVSGGGFADETIPASVLSEGFGMLRTLISDFKAAGHHVATMLDSRVARFNPPLDADCTVPVSSCRETKKNIRKLSEQADAAYVIAPETDGVLQSLVELVEQSGAASLNCRAGAITKVSGYGNRLVQTPRIDRLAAEGVRCSDFYIASPSCMPSRGALLTGRHPLRTGLNEQIWKIDEREQVGLSRSEVVLPRYLARAGYVSGCFGKWNLGFAPGSRPTDRGFDEYFGNISGNCDYYTHVYSGRNDLYRGTEPVKVEGYSTFLFADAACDFIARNKDRPFFCYVPFNAAHYPNPRNKAPGAPCIWQAPDEAFNRYGYSPQTLDEPSRYRAVLAALDDGVGWVLDQLDRLKLTEKTIVIALSDNGAFLLPKRGLECASNAPLRSGGVTVWEGGIRVPCILRWPGRIEPGTVCRESLSSMDFVPMALRVAGLALPTDRVLDGKDPTDTLAGRSGSPHTYLYWRWGKAGAAIRMGRYKLIREQDSPEQDWQLFDLTTDLGESTDLRSAKPDVAERLKTEYDRWMAEVTGLPNAAHLAGGPTSAG